MNTIVPTGLVQINDYAFIFSASHWRDGKIQVEPMDDDNGYKGRSHYLMEKFNPTYSHRAGYTLSPKAACKLVEAMSVEDYKSPAEVRTAKAEAAHIARVIAFVVKHGGVAGSNGREATISTRHGKLNVHPFGTCVCTRFEVPNVLTGGNCKWNFHGDDAASDFAAALVRILG